MRVRGIASGAWLLVLAAQAVAQQPAKAPAEQPIVLMRTAGQPDRQLKVLKYSNFTDGESVAEVQDVVTGQVFTLPGKVVATLPKAVPVAVPAPTPVAAKPVIPAPAKPVAPKADEQPMPKVTIIPAPALAVTPVEAKLTPPVPKEAVAATPAPGAMLVWRAKSDGATPLAPTEPAKPDRWQPAKRMNPQSSLAPSQTIVRATHHTGHDDPDERPAVRVIRPHVVEERAELAPVAYRSVETQIRDETQEYVYDLVSALRPSIRENAAICLAESRYGSRPEIKGALARAAIADPAPSVRAKCIQLLMQLGYHDADYMAYLQSAITPGEAPTLVKLAAKEALAKLMPRN